LTLFLLFAWLTLDVLLVMHLVNPKLQALLIEGLALGTIFTYFHAAKATRYVRALLICNAFVVGWWTIGLARQLIFEVATTGHITERLDSCFLAFFGIVLLPITTLAVLTFGALLAFAIFIPMRWCSVYNLALNRSISIGMPIVAALTGAAFGLTSWHDWQVDTPCL
jgi:hypothetical protein